MNSKKTILCIDNDEDACELVKFVFQNIGFEITACGTPEEAIRLARTINYVAIITDFHLDGIDGTDLCRAVRTFNTKTPIVFLTGETRAEHKQAAMNAGAQAYFTKPVDFMQFERTITELINENQR